jgi:hypothetical protein
MHRLCASLQRLAERGILVESDGPDPLLAPEKPMSTSEQLLANARQRGQMDSLPYAGAVTPEEAHSLLQANANVKLIDVRTQAERDWVGRVILPDAQHLAAQWTLYPGGAPNSEFLRQLEQQAQRHAAIPVSLGGTFALRCETRHRKRL